MSTNDSPVDRCLNDSGYTPPARAVPELLGALAMLTDDAAERVERVLARVGVEAGVLALAHAVGADARHRRRLLGVARRVASEAAADRLLQPLLTALADADAKCRRLAVRALGNLGAPAAEAPLLARLRDEELPERRAIVEALGKVGGTETLAALAALARSDAELDRRARQAETLISRRAARADSSALELDRPLGERVAIAALCRSGLAELLRDELRAFSPRIAGKARVDAWHSGALSELLVARTALEFGLIVRLDESVLDPAERIARGLVHPDTTRRLATWTRGKVRFRLHWEPGGHQRALTWNIAKRVSECAPELVNESRDATWTARVALSASELLLVPRLQPDPRFDYRVRDVPGASHPTIAAALARLARGGSDDVVWDPFAGSGLELVERARIGPYSRLIGTDVDPKALEAARLNVDSARVERCEFVSADARTFAPEGVTCIVTNPPMGRRVTRDGTTGELLDAFLVNAARRLPRGGRLTWLSPFDARTARTAGKAGFSVESGENVDMGGFLARIQLLSRR